MELDAQAVPHGRRGSLTLAPVNKVHHVRTIALVAEMLGEDKDWRCGTSPTKWIRRTD